jgi:indole-3-acetate monooxygenase
MSVRQPEVPQAREGLLSQSEMKTAAVRSLIEAAAALAPRIVATRDQVETERRLPGQLVKELQDGGMFDLWLPRSFGGPELTPTEFARVIEVLAQADGSVGWCASVAAAFTRFSGFLDEAVARRIFLEDRAIVAGALAPTGKAVVVSDGYRVTGRWSFGSGIMHSSWTAGGAIVFEGDAIRRWPCRGVGRNWCSGISSGARLSLQAARSMH